MEQVVFAHCSPEYILKYITMNGKHCYGSTLHILLFSETNAQSFSRACDISSVKQEIENSTKLTLLGFN